MQSELNNFEPISITSCLRVFAMPPIYDNKGKFIFYPVAKAGHSSINRYLLSRRTVVRKDSGEDWREAKNNCESEDGIFTFTLVRNPYTRALSSFLYLQKLRFISKSLSFDDWVLNLKLPLPLNPNHNFRQSIGGVNFTINSHSFPQVCSFYNKRIDFMLHLETIEQDYLVLLKKLSMSPRKLAHNNRTKKNKPWQEYYSNKSIEAIQQKYYHDFKHCGYRVDINNINPLKKA
jgi:hypothetical protein